MSKETGSSTLYDFYGACPPVGQLIPLSLQHVLAAVVGVITPAIIVSGVCGLSDMESTMMIQAALIMTAVATLLQLFPVFNRIGAGLPVIMGTSFAYVPTLQAIGSQFDLATIFGAQIVGGLVAIFFGIFVKWIRKLFPDVVTGTVIFTIGLSLYPTAVRYMAGGSGSEGFGGLQNWIVAIVTFSVVFILNHFAKGIFKLGSLFFGMIVGYLAALCFGMVDFSALSEVTAIVSVPRFNYFEIKFVPAACVSLAVVYIVNSVQTIGDLTSTTMGGMDRVPTDRELSGGIITQGIVSILASFFGGLPTASYSQNVGIVTVNRVVNRFVFLLSALILLAAGFIPKLSALLTTIPQSVIGGATISVFAVIAMTGIRMFTKDGFDTRKSTIVGLSVALGAGITQVTGSLAGPGMPSWVATVFGSSSVVVSALLAIVLNLILPKHEVKKTA
ncbi:MAG: purine/pyrimidine permease [Lachnospiraceae bacterium]|nr:purine/pyrimidine permease [Lachnospiraceae bacterium]